MTNNLIASLNIVAPMAIYALVGHFAMKTNLLDRSFCEKANRLYFNLLLPCLLFVGLFDSAIDHIDGRLFLFVFAAQAITAVLYCLLVPLFLKQKRQISVYIIALLRTNTVVFGVPLAMGIMGGHASADVLLILGLVIVFHNFVTPIVYGVFGEQKGGFAEILKDTLTNPLLVAEAAAITVVKLRIPFPAFLVDSLRNLGAVSTPLAFICLGATFSIGVAHEHRNMLMRFLLIKLLAIPAVVMGIGAFAFHMRGAQIAAVIAVFATPTAISTYPIAQVMGGDEDLAQAMVVLSTAASIPTLFVFILLTKALGL